MSFYAWVRGKQGKGDKIVIAEMWFWSWMCIPEKKVNFLGFLHQLKKKSWNKIQKRAMKSNARGGHETNL